MLIAHFPAGYLCTRVLLQSRRDRIPASDYRIYFCAGLLGSVLPDVDILYYYLRYYIAGQWYPGHHAYWSHTPFYWLIIFTVLIVSSLAFKRQRFLFALYIGGMNLLLHFWLDSFAGRIKWLYPISNKAFGIFTIPRHYQWWVWDYAFHWTFGIELAIVVVCLYVVINDIRYSPGCLNDALRTINRAVGK